MHISEKKYTTKGRETSELSIHLEKLKKRWTIGQAILAEINKKGMHTYNRINKVKRWSLKK